VLYEVMQAKMVEIKMQSMQNKQAPQQQQLAS